MNSPDQTHLLRASALSLFRYNLSDAQGQELGRMTMPDKLPVARNSPLRGALPGNWEDFVRFELQGKHWRLEYETYPEHGIRYFLLPEPVPAKLPPLATAAAKGKGPWQIQWQEQNFELCRQSAWKFGFVLSQSGHELGALRETTRLLALRRRFEVDLPGDWPLEIRAFVFYLGVVQVFR